MGASPLLLLQPETNTRAEGAIRSTARSVFGRRAECTSSRTHTDANRFREYGMPLPRVLMFNAESDMGLKAHGMQMAETLRSPQFAISVEHKVVPGTNHASICWTDAVLADIVDFVCRCG